MRKGGGEERKREIERIKCFNDVKHWKKGLFKKAKLFEIQNGAINSHLSSLYRSLLSYLIAPRR